MISMMPKLFLFKQSFKQIGGFQMTIEMIVQNGTEAIEAEKMGADRLELVSAISEGGLTPSYGTIKQVLKSVSIPVYIMIRPHSHHYFYTDGDLEIIQEDIKQVLKLGGHRIVFGTLNRDLTINEEVLQTILDISPQLELTFHRAFDETRSVMDAYQTLTKYKQQIKTILTSGGANDCVAGMDNLEKLVKLSQKNQGPQIMPGSGLSLDNVEQIHESVQASQYHFGKAIRLNHSFASGFDEKTIQNIRTKIISHNM